MISKNSIIKENIKISFGIIVLNGMPYIKYNLRSLYPFAHQIIVVEGAAPSAKHVATEDGHSIDSTLDELRLFKMNEDPNNKITIITAEDEGYINGFWPEKDAMSQAYANKADGNYLWQIDSDEFYLEEDMFSIINILENDSTIKSISFPMYTFWGDPNFIVNGYFLDNFVANRLFAWGKGFKYSSHRPVTILDENSNNLRDFKWLSHEKMRNHGIYMYHYELLFPKQVEDKCSYYKDAKWTTALTEVDKWLNNNYKKISNPFRVHMMYNYISWLKKFNKKHPEQIIHMLNDVKEGNYPYIFLRDMSDVVILMSSNIYKFKLLFLESLIPIIRIFKEIKIYVKSTIFGNLIIRFKNKLRGGLTKIHIEDVNFKIENAWKNNSIPAQQRLLTKLELKEMYSGKIIRPFDILASCIKEIQGEGKSIIEIGCSTGYYSEVLDHLLGKNINYIGVDYSDEMIRVAKKTYPEKPFFVDDATNLNFKNKEFEIVISGCCLLHIPNYKEAISEASRITSEWVIFHRTPVIQAKTQFFKKKAYGVSCVEIHFNETEFLDICKSNNLHLIKEINVTVAPDYTQKTFLFKKNGN